MSIILDNYRVPPHGHVDLKINLSFEIKVTAEEARHKVQRWLSENVSHLLGAEQPALAVSDRAIWRVPAWIGFPSLGRVGVVGTVEVDVETGEMKNLSESRQEIERHLEELRPHLPTAKQVVRELPVDYMANLNPPPALLSR